MRVVAYARYSTDAQREESIRDQVRNCRRWAERNGFTLHEIFADEGLSGSRSDRPDYNRLLAAAQRGDFEILLVDDLSRLSRDSLESNRVLRLMAYYEIRVVGVSDGIDTERKGSKLETGMRGMINEIYLDDLREKTHRGLEGQHGAGFAASKAPYGYRTVRVEKGSVYEIEPEQAEVVRRIFELYAGGYSARAIASVLNEERVPAPRSRAWTHTAIFPDRRRGIGILANEIYVGRVWWNRSVWIKDPETGRRRRRERPREEWLLREDESLRIVSEELWEAALARSRDTNRPQAKSCGPGSGRLFSGLLSCGVCGGSFSVVAKDRYGCGRHRSGGPAACSNSLRVSQAILERVLLGGVIEQMTREETIEEGLKLARKLLEEGKPDAAAAKRALAEAERVKENIMSALRQGIVTPSTKKELVAAEAAVSDAKRRVDEVNDWAPAKILPRAREAWKKMAADLASLDTQSIPEAREFLRNLLGEIVLRPDSEGYLVAELAPTLPGMERIQPLVAGAGTVRLLHRLELPLRAA